jgi:hypothetical protein
MLYLLPLGNCIKVPHGASSSYTKGDKVVYALPQSALEEIEAALEECGGSDDDEY